MHQCKVYKPFSGLRFLQQHQQAIRWRKGPKPGCFKSKSLSRFGEAQQECLWRDRCRGLICCASLQFCFCFSNVEKIDNRPTMADMNGARKSRSRRRRGETSSHNGGLFPSQVVCSASAASNSKSIELGVILTMLVMGLYLYAFWSSIQSLPDVNTGFHIGSNLNLAKLESISLEENPMVNNNNVAGQQEAVKHHNEKDNQQNNDNNKHIKSKKELIGGAPIGQWPVNLSDEINDYETLLHPGDLQTPMKLPKLWSRPLHHGKLFTRNQAMNVGTCIEPDPTTGSYVRGDKCPLEKRTIYIAIASYRDFQCRQTVESIFTRAKYPERLRVGK